MNINYVAVVAAAVINMIVGAAWYSPALFGKQWSALLGKKMEDMRKNAGPGYGVAAVTALVQAFILAKFVGYAGAATVMAGAGVGLMAWLGFTGATSASNTVFAGRPWKLWAIDSGYFLVVLIVNGALLATWK